MSPRGYASSASAGPATCVQTCCRWSSWSFFVPFGRPRFRYWVSPCIGPTLHADRSGFSIVASTRCTISSSTEQWRPESPQQSNRGARIHGGQYSQAQRNHQSNRCCAGVDKKFIAAEFPFVDYFSPKLDFAVQLLPELLGRVSNDFDSSLQQPFRYALILIEATISC